MPPSGSCYLTRRLAIRPGPSNAHHLVAASLKFVGDILNRCIVTRFAKLLHSAVDVGRALATECEQRKRKWEDSARSKEELENGKAGSSGRDVSTGYVALAEVVEELRHRRHTNSTQLFDGPERVPHKLVDAASRLVEYLVAGCRDLFADVNRLPLVDGITRDHSGAHH